MWNAACSFFDCLASTWQTYKTVQLLLILDLGHLVDIGVEA